jgi:hypothetical protein
VPPLAFSCTSAREARAQAAPAAERPSSYRRQLLRHPRGELTQRYLSCGLAAWCIRRAPAPPAAP